MSLCITSVVAERDEDSCRAVRDLEGGSTAFENPGAFAKTISAIAKMKSTEMHNDEGEYGFDVGTFGTSEDSCNMD